MKRLANESKQEWLDRVSKLYELELETIKELAQDSLEETSNHLDVLKEIDPENLEEAERAAHSIKGVAASLSQASLREAAEEVEEQLRNKQLDGIEEKIKLLQSSFDEFKVFIDE